MQADNKSSNKWCKIVVEECVKHFVDIWDERNSQIHTQMMQVKKLQNRIEELHSNENNFDFEIKEAIAEARNGMEKMSANQLRLKLEVIRSKIKKSKRKRVENRMRMKKR